MQTFLSLTFSFYLFIYFLILFLILFIFVCFLLISQMKCGFAPATLVRDDQKDAQSIQILLLFSSLAHWLCFSVAFLLSPFFPSVFD